MCNPPYVVSPDSAFLYRDGGMAGDGTARKVVKEIPARLREGGFATVLVNWTHDGSWSEPLREWVEESGCDALLLRYATSEPEEYAARWNREIGLRDPQRFERTVARWIDYYRKSGIRAIASGAVVLRRRAAGPNRVRAIEAADGPTAPSGEHLLRLFAADDFLASVGTDGRFAERAFSLVEGHRVEQSLRHEDGRYVAEAANVCLQPGIGLAAQVNARVLEIQGGALAGYQIGGARGAFNKVEAFHKIEAFHKVEDGAARLFYKQHEDAVEVFIKTEDGTESFFLKHIVSLEGVQAFFHKIADAGALFTIQDPQGNTAHALFSTGQKGADVVIEESPAQDEFGESPGFTHPGD